jgi:hypothetical protein
MEPTPPPETKRVNSFRRKTIRAAAPAPKAKDEEQLSEFDIKPFTPPIMTHEDDSGDGIPMDF